MHFFFSSGFVASFSLPTCPLASLMLIGGPCTWLHRYPCRAPPPIGTSSLVFRPEFGCSSLETVWSMPIPLSNFRYSMYIHILAYRPSGKMPRVPSCAYLGKLGAVSMHVFMFFFFVSLSGNQPPPFSLHANPCPTVEARDINWLALSL